VNREPLNKDLSAVSMVKPLCCLRLLGSLHRIRKVSEPPNAHGRDGTVGIFSIARGTADVEPAHGAVPRERAERVEIHATTRDDRQTRTGALDKLTKVI